MASKVKQTEQKQEFHLKQAFVLWKHTSKSGKDYFTGRDENGNNLVGFYNGKKKNPKEPDLRVYIDTEKGTETKMEECSSLWCNVSEKTNRKYLTGSFNGEKVVAFINNGKNEKAPYLRVYYREDVPQQTKIQEDVEMITDDDCPF